MESLSSDHISLYPPYQRAGSDWFSDSLKKWRDWLYWGTREDRRKRGPFASGRKSQTNLFRNSIEGLGLILNILLLMMAMAIKPRDALRSELFDSRVSL